MTLLEPEYGRRSLGDVVPAVARALGRPLDPGTAPDRGTAGAPGLVLPDAEAYVLFLVDGLGARQLARYEHAAPYLSSLRVVDAAATAGVPSTTATSLTSLGTGLTPGAHGVVGYSSRIPGTDRLLFALGWDAAVDPREWQPHPTTFTRLQAAGVTTTVVNKREFAGSGLTEAAHRGADFVGADKVGERIAATQRVSARTPSLTYLYDGDLDWTGHRHGVASTAWLQQLAMIDSEAEQLRESLPASVRLLVVADHGMVDADPAQRFDVDALPELSAGVSLFGGEARFRQLYCQRGAVDDVVAAWRGTLGDAAEVLTREEAVARGWFGPVSPTVVPRLGDVLVACRDRASVVSTVGWAHESRLVGLHGSLTPDEMLIPVLLD